MIAQVCQSASTHTVNREVGKTPEQGVVWITFQGDLNYSAECKGL